jgi:hypothetical protein
MSAGTILLGVVIVMLFGVLPDWPYSRSWGYAPVGVLSVLALVIAAVLVMGWV